MAAGAGATECRVRQGATGSAAGGAVVNVDCQYTIDNGD